MGNILEIENFTQQYNDLSVAVDNISLSVAEGEIFGFIGHNGAGKSTTIKSVVGILPVRKGAIRIMGQSVSEHLRDCQRQCAYVPDNPELYGYMTGMGYISFIADIYGVPEDVRAERIRRYGEAFEILPQLGSLISTYSHGMRQKTALIAALVHQPKLLVLDEPFVGLDPKATATLKGIMRELCAGGSAVFFSTHVLDVAERLCDRVGMLDHGRLIVEGRIAELTAGCTLEELFLRKLSERKNPADGEKNADA